MNLPAQTDVAMEELEYVLEQQCTSMERSKGGWRSL